MDPPTLPPELIMMIGRFHEEPWKLATVGEAMFRWSLDGLLRKSMGERLKGFLACLHTYTRLRYATDMRSTSRTQLNTNALEYLHFALERLLTSVDWHRYTNVRVADLEADVDGDDDGNLPDSLTLGYYACASPVSTMTNMMAATEPELNAILTQFAFHPPADVPLMLGAADDVTQEVYKTRVETPLLRGFHLLGGDINPPMDALCVPVSNEQLDVYLYFPEKMTEEAESAILHAHAHNIDNLSNALVDTHIYIENWEEINTYSTMDPEKTANLEGFLRTNAQYARLTRDVSGKFSPSSVYMASHRIANVNCIACKLNVY